MDYYQLKPALMVCDFNFEMIMTIKTHGENELHIDGNFRTTGDFGGLRWNAEDTWGHPALKYQTEYDFTGVKLSYDYQLSGAIIDLDLVNGMTLTVKTVSGELYYVRLWNYVVDRPLDDWEVGAGVLFPAGRTPANATGSSGHIVIDFDNLYAGWAAYEWYELGWIPSPSWVKIDPSEIKSLMWGFSPSWSACNYFVEDKNVRKPTGRSDEFSVVFSNWTVENARPLGSSTSFEPHFYRLADGFDDSYSATPERFIETFYDLGFREYINMYIGASHYYDKYGDPNKPTPEGYVPYQYYVIDDPYKDVLNLAFRTYFQDFCERAKAKGYKLVIGSVSLEMVDALEAWWQRTADGEPATSGWTPTPYFVSFTNPDVQAFYRRYVQEIAAIESSAGLVPCIQLGEPWWWNEGVKPCFYDASTRDKFLQEKGYPLPEYYDMWQTTYDVEALMWLQEQNGNFIEVIKNAVPDAELTVLFFPPTVIDTNRVGEMMQIVNFPVDHWKNISRTRNLHFFMIEDYDWIIDNDPMHKIVYDFVWDTLKYQWFRTHYFAGFALNPQSQDNPLWERINEALIDGVNHEFESYVWAGTQLRRDGWLPPELFWKTKMVRLEDANSGEILSIKKMP